MELSHTAYKHCDLVKVSGRIDSATSGEFEKKIKEIQSAGRSNIVIDMEAVEFLSSRGLRVLVEGQKASKNGGGQVALAVVPENIRDTLKLVGMADYFQFFDDVIGAVASF